MGVEVDYTDFDPEHLIFVAPQTFSTFEGQKYYSGTIKYGGGDFKLQTPILRSARGLQFARDEKKKIISGKKEASFITVTYEGNEKVGYKDSTQTFTRGEVAESYIRRGGIPDVLKEKIIQHIIENKKAYGLLGQDDDEIRMMAKKIIVPEFQKDKDKVALKDEPKCNTYKVTNYLHEFVDEKTNKKMAVRRRAPFTLPIKTGNTKGQDLKFEDISGCELEVRLVIHYRGIYVRSDKISVQCQVTSAVVFGLIPYEGKAPQEDLINEALEDDDVQDDMKQIFENFKKMKLQRENKNASASEGEASGSGDAESSPKKDDPSDEIKPFNVNDAIASIKMDDD